MRKQTLALPLFVTGAVLFVYGLWFVFSVLISAHHAPARFVVPTATSLTGIALIVAAVASSGVIGRRPKRNPEPMFH